MTEDDRTVLSFFVGNGRSQEVEEVTAAENLIGEARDSDENAAVDVAMDDPMDEDIARETDVNSENDDSEDEDSEDEDSEDEDTEDDGSEDEDYDIIITDPEDEGMNDVEEEDNQI